MRDRSITVRAFLQDLRWMLPLTVGAILLLVLLDVGGMGDLTVIEAVSLGVGFWVVLGPLTWLGWERSMFVERTDTAFWGFLGGSVVWAVVSMAGVALILNALGIE